MHLKEDVRTRVQMILGGEASRDRIRAHDLVEAVKKEQAVRRARLACGRLPQSLPLVAMLHWALHSLLATTIEA